MPRFVYILHCLLKSIGLSRLFEAISNLETKTNVLDIFSPVTLRNTFAITPETHGSTAPRANTNAFTIRGALSTDAPFSWGLSNPSARVGRLHSPVNHQTTTAEIEIYSFFSSHRLQLIVLFLLSLYLVLQLFIRIQYCLRQAGEVVCWFWLWKWEMRESNWSVRDCAGFWLTIFFRECLHTARNAVILCLMSVKKLSHWLLDTK